MGTAPHKDTTARPANDEFRAESVERELASMYAQWSRSARIEAIISIVVGLAIIPCVYLLFWLCVRWLLRLATHSQIHLAGPFGAEALALGGIWLALGTIVAWRHVGPLSEPQPPPGRSHDRFIDPPLARIDRGEFEVSDPGSWLQAETFAALVAAGPRQVLEGFVGLRDVPSLSSQALARAGQLLVQAARPEGLTARTFVRDEVSAQAMAALWRLKLLRSDGSFTERWRIRVTTLGDETART